MRTCLGRFVTGVTVVTVRSGDVVHGATVNAFMSVSLDPPLVMVSLDRRSRACALLDGSEFGVNVLGADQEHLAMQFAGRPSLSDDEVPWDDRGDAPKLAGTSAYFSCEPWAAYDGGDHVLYVGRVRALECSEREPLVFHKGKLRHLGEVVDEAPWTGTLDCPTDLMWRVPAGERNARPAPSSERPEALSAEQARRRVRQRKEPVR